VDLDQPVGEDSTHLLCQVRMNQIIREGHAKEQKIVHTASIPVSHEDRCLRRYTDIENGSDARVRDHLVLSIGAYGRPCSSPVMNLKSN